MSPAQETATVIAYTLTMTALCALALVMTRDAARVRKQKAEEQSPASIINQHRVMPFEGKRK